MKYKIIFEWRSGGFGFEDEEFSTVAEAVKHAVGLNYSVPFLIVQVIDWKAVEVEKERELRFEKLSNGKENPIALVNRKLMKKLKTKS